MTKEEIRDYQRRWRLLNPGYQKQYREANRDTIAATRKVKRLANLDKEAERHKIYYAANRDQIRSEASGVESQPP